MNNYTIFLKIKKTERFKISQITLTWQFLSFWGGKTKNVTMNNRWFALQNRYFATLSMTESFYHSGGFSVECSRAKQTCKQDIFDKTTLCHSEGNARRIYIKSTKNNIDIASWAYRKTKSEFIKIIPRWNGWAFCFFA